MIRQAGSRRRARNIRRVPAWDQAPAMPAPAAYPIRKRLRRRYRLAIALLVGGAVGLPLWVVFRDTDTPVPMPAPARVQTSVVDVELPPPAPEETPEFAQPDPTVPVPPETPVASVPSTPSIGLVSTGPTGGSGNGVPGLDLGLEGTSGAGMAVASGGGGSGGGVGTGTGSGIGTARFVYQAGQVDQDAKPSGTLAEPAYPRRADEDGIEALVEVRVLVDERGHVEQVEVLGAPAGYGFEASIRKAAARWRFEPAKLGGVQVPQWVRIPWHFRRPG